jgi:non-reducing end alpha-L-arabinofuranosidase
LGGATGWPSAGGASGGAAPAGSNGGGSAGAAGSKAPDAAAGGATGSGGGPGAGGTVTAAGGAGGSTSSPGGTGGTAGATGTGTPGPCDIYQAGNTPCVAAHSTVRALYQSYNGPLYQLRKGGSANGTGGTTQDVMPLAPGGFVDTSTHESFCPTGTTCTISVIYDQSPQKNDLVVATPTTWVKNALEAPASSAKHKVGGHTAYGVYVAASAKGIGYRNNKAKGLAKGDDPESMYMVVDGKRYAWACCFDYGNAETNGIDNGKATMECMLFSSNNQWAKGNGNGPWIMADIEDGVYPGGDPNSVTATNTPIVANYVTGMLVGYSGNRMVLKAGDAQSGKIMTKYDGVRPPGYSPQKKEGAIVLGTGGDGSDGGDGTFFEGAITTGISSTDTDEAIQANIVAAGYGK